MPTGTTRTRRRRPSSGDNGSADGSSKGQLALSLPSRKAKDGPDEESLLAMVPGGLATAFVNARLHDKAIAVAGLGTPPDWEGAMPEIPDDLASTDHNTMSNLMGQFVNALSTATWRASTAYVEHGFYVQIADYLESIALLESQQSNEGKRKADAATSEPVVSAKALVQTAYSDYVRFRDLATTLKLKHATISRVGGFVGDEAESEDQLRAPSLSTRGASPGKAVGSQRKRTRIRSRK
jgi:hypothetical protein